MRLQGRPPATPRGGGGTSLRHCVPAQGCMALLTRVCTQGSVCWCQLCRCPSCHPQSQRGSMVPGAWHATAARSEILVIWAPASSPPPPRPHWSHVSMGASLCAPMQLGGWGGHRRSPGMARAAVGALGPCPKEGLVQTGTIPAGVLGRVGRGEGKARGAQPPAAPTNPTRVSPIPCRPLPMGPHRPRGSSPSPRHARPHGGHGEGKRSCGGGAGQGLQD